MSILIKRMEMPKSCDKCELMTANYGCVFVGAVGGESYRKRAWDCPLVEVPEQKHGKWMGEYNGWEDDYWCSECKSQALYKEGGSHDQTLSEYCPNCGALMDSE